MAPSVTVSPKKQTWPLVAIGLVAAILGWALVVFVSHSPELPDANMHAAKQSGSPNSHSYALDVQLNSASNGNRSEVDSANPETSPTEVSYPPSFPRRDPLTLAKPEVISGAKHLLGHQEINPTGKVFTPIETAELEAIIGNRNSKINELQRQSALVNARWARAKIDMGEGIDAKELGRVEPHASCLTNVVDFSDGRSVAIYTFRGESAILDQTVDDMWTEYQNGIEDCVRFVNDH